MNHHSTEKIKLLRSGEIVTHIQQSISKAANSIRIVGPWLDAYFVRNVIDSIGNENIELSILVRIEDDEVIDIKTLSALNLARKNIKNFQASTLKNLHSKVILIR